MNTWSKNKIKYFEPLMQHSWGNRGLFRIMPIIGCEFKDQLLIDNENKAVIL